VRRVLLAAWLLAAPKSLSSQFKEDR
jgi:hypothetical protein